MQKTLSVINLETIKNNLLKVRRLTGKAAFYAVVKADAYGHGAEEVARYTERYVDGFCTAITEEAVALRIAGITKPVLVLTPPLDGFDAARAQTYGLTVTVNSAETARLVAGLPCHIKVNTGMNRLGANLAQLPAILKLLPPESVHGVYSHLYAPHDERASAVQLAFFKRAARLVKTFVPHATAHISASGGILRGGEYVMDGVRAGILLYGYQPEGFAPCGVKPALKVYARRVQTTEFIGGGIGYNRAERIYGTLSAYRCGYADGFRRDIPLGEKTLCMDSFISAGGEKLACVMDNADEYAAQCGTIAYEVLTNVTHRSERIYER